jgi:2'-5' RNA ligase
MQKKIFIGVKISENLQKQIILWQKKHENLPVRWLKPENMHLTIIPPWLEKDLEKVKEKMSILARQTRPIKINFEKISFGSDPKHPKLIWLTGKSPEFKPLRDKWLEFFSVVSDHREALPHVTIARFAMEDFKKFDNQNLEEKVDWPEEVRNITLFESLGNSEYKILHDIKI